MPPVGPELRRRMPVETSAIPWCWPRSRRSARLALEPYSFPTFTEATLRVSAKTSSHDLEKAAGGYAGFGKLSGREVAFPEFGAVAREIVLARGSIFLLQATGPSGPSAQRIKTSGGGLFGMRLAVTDLGQARKVIGKKTFRRTSGRCSSRPKMQRGHGRSFTGNRTESAI